MVLNCRGAPAHFLASTDEQKSSTKDWWHIPSSIACDGSSRFRQQSFLFFFVFFVLFLMYQFFRMKMINDNNFSAYAWCVSPPIATCLENGSMKDFLFTIHINRAVWRNSMMRNWQLCQQQLNQNQRSRTWVRVARIPISRPYGVDGMRRRATEHLWWAETQREQKIKVIDLRSCLRKFATEKKN